MEVNRKNAEMIAIELKYWVLQLPPHQDIGATIIDAAASPRLASLRPTTYCKRQNLTLLLNSITIEYFMERNRC